MKRQLALLTAAVSLTAGSSTAIGGPGYTTTLEYYSDATHTVVVGQGTFTCQGRWVIIGTKTNFAAIIEESGCN